jgi:hypothetical protein
MAGKDQGSLTKEPPLATHDATIRAITPGMPYSSLLAYARANTPNTHRDAPGLISKRYLLVSKDGTITYDHFLSLTKIYPLESPFIRKIMYFLWAYRDERIRRFVCERIADKGGEWRIPQVTNKANSKFFETWLQPSTAQKARSTFEYFLVETNIYDIKSRTVHLGLDDGWLDQAAIAAAQHESNPIDREDLLTNPIAFLVKRGWLGLVNTTEKTVPTTSPILSSVSVPLEDYAIRTRPLISPIASDWDRHSPTASGRTSVTATIDLVARERANKSHYMLEEILVSLAKRQSLSPKYNQSIDIFFDTPHGPVLAEIKSCTDNNFHSQIRKGVSQLFEYRFLNKSLFSSEFILLLLVETVPPKEKIWIVDYLLSVGILLAWKDASTQTIVTTCSIPPALAGIITNV